MMNPVRNNILTLLKILLFSEQIHIRNGAIGLKEDF